MGSPAIPALHLGEDGHAEVLLTGFINEANKVLVGDWSGEGMNGRAGERQQSKPCIPPGLYSPEMRDTGWGEPPKAAPAYGLQSSGLTSSPSPACVGRERCHTHAEIVFSRGSGGSPTVKCFW